MLPSETMIWQPEFTDKTLSRKPGAVQPPSISISRKCFAAGAYCSSLQDNLIDPEMFLSTLDKISPVIISAAICPVSVSENCCSRSSGNP
ncbi:hypothetical protein EW649_18960 [Escherichia coli O145]|nr:hypothetical protein EW647_19470 [Escherichia coli O145]QNS86994.1 hypothetical protein EW649_18960 [Escherichia coli O145]